MQMVALGEVCASIDYGLTASASADPRGPKFLRITDIQNDYVDWDSVPYCTATDSEERGNGLRSGDIVFARTGATTGKSYLIRQCPQRAVFASYLIRVRPGAQLDSIYLSHFFQSQHYWNQIRICARGAAQPGVNSTLLRTLQVPICSLSEQRRIAAILDQADALRRLRSKTIILSARACQAIFNAMFSRATLRRRPLSDLLDIEAGLVDPQDSRYADLPHIGPERIVRDSGELFQIRTAREDGVTSGKYLFDGNAVLYSKIRPYLNKVALAPGRGLCSADVYVLKPKPERLCRIFLWFLLRQRDFLRYAETLSNRANIPKINREQLLAYGAPTPDISDQTKFARRVKHIMDVKDMANAQRGRLEHLFSAMQRQAFGFPR